eukprot:g32875.t1
MLLASDGHDEEQLRLGVPIAVGQILQVPPADVLGEVMVRDAGAYDSHQLHSFKLRRRDEADEPGDEPTQIPAKAGFDLPKDDIDAACEIARSFPDFTAESISKERDGDYDIGVPSQNKIYEMVAKIRLFDETASEHLKTSLQHEVSGVKDRISQLQSALLRTVALKFEKKFSCFSHSMGMVANGQQNEQNSASCMQMLNDMSTYQALPPKMSLVKLLGKEKATEVDTAVASITHLATLMHKAFPQVVQLTTSAATEGLLTNESVVALFASLHDSNIQKAFASAAPMWKSTIEDLDTFIQNCVAKTLVKATDTFHPFVLKLLGEIDVDSMLDAKVVGLPADGEAEEQESNVF